MAGRTNKPYAVCLLQLIKRRTKSQRPSKANPDAAGSWKHDLHQSPSLADRLSGSSRSSGPSTKPSLLSRISGGQGKGLIPQGGKGQGNKGKELFGFGSIPPINQSNVNAGVELLGPSTSTSVMNTNGRGVVRTPRGFQAQDGNRSLAQSGFNAALGQAFGREKREARRVEESRRQEVSILGAGNKSIVVRVANLAQGTTAEDVVVSCLVRESVWIFYVGRVRSGAWIFGSSFRSERYFRNQGMEEVRSRQRKAGERRDRNPLTLVRIRSNAIPKCNSIPLLLLSLSRLGSHLDKRRK